MELAQEIDPISRTKAIEEAKEVLKLCEKLCNCKFESIKKMLSDNWFYKEILG